MITLSLRPILSAALLYLALPWALFLWGWVQAWAAIPLILATGYGVYHILKKTPAEKRHLSWRGAGVPGVLSLLCLLLTFACGFTGHFDQHADFAVRNYIYQGLIAEEFPLTMPDGQAFIYYIGHWLCPAVVAKMLPAPWADAVLVFWTYLGLQLTLLIAFLRWGGRKTLAWAVIMFCLGSPLATLQLIGFYPGIWVTDYNAQMVQQVPMFTQLFNTFNHAVPALLYATLLLTGALPKTGYFLVGSWLLLHSPLAGLCLLPFILYEELWHKEGTGEPFLTRLTALLKSPLWWIACAEGWLLAVFYSGLDGGGQFCCLFNDAYANLYHYGLQEQLTFSGTAKYGSFTAALLMGIILPVALLYPASRRLPFYYLCFGTLTAALFFRTGIMNNELLLKAPAVLFPVLALLFYQALKQAKSSLRCGLLLYLIFIAIAPLSALTDKLTTITLTPHRLPPPAELNTPAAPLYRQFTKAPDCQLPPWLFKNKYAQN